MPWRKDKFAATDPATSADLLRRVRAGDERAADEVFTRYVERLTRLARSRLAAKLAARVDPEDIVQSAYRSFFVAARQGRFAIDESGDLWRLLVEVTLHKLYRQAARHKAQRRNVECERASADGSIWERVAGTQPTPEQAEIAAEELEAVLQKLPPRGRTVVELVLQGFEQREIAAKLSCTERTVRRWIEAARAILRTKSLRSARLEPSRLERASRAPATRPAPRPPAKSPPPADYVDRTDVKWSDYLLQTQIGTGATGKVYRALERRTGRHVAVKFLRKALVREPSVVRRFLREAQTVRSLNHPRIVSVQGVGRTRGGGWFLVMDLIRGRNLESAVRHKRASASQAAAWMAEAARIVQAAHDQGVVHCDLKPGNLLLDEQGAIWVTDFGLAIRAADEAPGALLAGTPAFMAPEQVDPCWGPISRRTDVWGLGAVLYYLLYGRPPHQGRDVADTLAQVVAGTSVRFPTRRTGDTRRYVEICRRCLAKRPDERFASAGELARALS